MDDRLNAYGRAYQIQALLRCAMLAEENETSGLEWKGTAQVLALTEEMMGHLVDRVEELEMRPSTCKKEHLEEGA